MPKNDLIPNPDGVPPRYQNLKKDQYRILFTMDYPELRKSSGGELVVAKEYVESAKVTVGESSGEAKHLIKTTDGGLVPICFLEPREDVPAKPTAGVSLEDKIRQHHGYGPELGGGCWWLGRYSPVHAACLLTNGVTGQMGNFVVCQPPEWDTPAPNQWKEFCLAVRNYTGSVKQMVWEWREAEYFNMRFGKEFKERRLDFDSLPSPPVGPVPSVAFFVIRRTEKGEFFVEKDKVFLSIESLLWNYRSNLLPVMKPSDPKSREFPLVLQEPIEAHNKYYNTPIPLLFPMPCPGYKLPGNDMWVLGGPSDFKTIKPRIWKVPLLEGEKMDHVRRAYMHLEGSYHPVVIRKMRAHRFNAKLFNAAIKQVQDAEKKQAGLRGGNFISHIVAYGSDKETDQKMNWGEWMAYEAVVGMPLDKLLLKRRYDNVFLSTRTKLEILYQVAYAMRFLEDNGLCHRHLTGANVVVESEQVDHMTIKVTDYLVPHHIKEPAEVEKMDKTDVEWPWWAPDSFKFRCFDILTDVWGFGCFAFEVDNSGLAPYSFENPQILSHTELQKFFDKGQSMTMVEGDNHPSIVTNIMELCLRLDPKERPSFVYLSEMLQYLLFDFSRDTADVVKQYVKNAPKTYERAYKRPELPDKGYTLA